MAIQAGQDIGRYHIVEPLGKGGMATVYRAYDTRLKKDVAVKFIRREMFSEMELGNMLARFDQEAVSLARLTHPNIIPIIDYDRFDDTPYLVMPFIAGGTLKDTISRMLKQGKTFTPAEAARLLVPIARALEYAHQRGVLHRDVKPANILVTESGEPMLSDFGIARILDIEGNTLTGTGMGVGTPDYAAPEQWLGKPGPCSDQYALGIVLYEMLTGHRPYTADTPPALMLMHINDPLPRPREYIPNLPDNVEKVLFTALAKKPENRFSSMGEFGRALESLAAPTPSNEETLDRPRPLPEPLPSPRPPSPQPSPRPDEGTLDNAVTPTLPDVETFDNPMKPEPKKPDEGRLDNIKPSLPPDKPHRPQKSSSSGSSRWVWAAGLAVLLVAGALGGWLIFGRRLVPMHPDQPGLPGVVPTLANKPGAGKNEACAKDAFGCAVIPAGQTVKIGMGVPLSGVSAQLGFETSQAAQMAAADGGDIDGFQFELVAGDDNGESDKVSIDVANKFVANPAIVAVAGHFFTAPNLAAIPVYEKAGIPMMEPLSPEISLTQAGSKVFNRLHYSAPIEGRFAAEYLYNRLGKKKIAIIHDGFEDEQALAEAVAARFKELGGQVVIIKEIESSLDDYTRPLMEIAPLKPDALYFSGVESEAVVVVNQMEQSGLKGVLFFGSTAVSSYEFTQQTKGKNEGFYAASDVPRRTDAVVAFNRAFKAKFGDSVSIDSYWAWYSYDATAALIQAVKNVAIKGADGSLYIPRSALMSAVRNLKDFKGLTGTYTCQPNGECSASGPAFLVVKDGLWVYADK